MKKLISIISLSLILLTSIAVLATNTTNSSTNQTQTNSIILYVKSSILDPNTNFYIAEVLTENGDLYVIQSFDDISGHWLDATITAQGEITDYTIMD